MSQEWIWSQKYRPKTIDECILPESVKQIARGYVASGKIPNMILANPNPGVGKTTLAFAICEEAGVDYMVVNASLNANIDNLRNSIQQFASTVSFTASAKVVILEEFDGASAQFMAGFRAFLEEYSSSCTFIITCNYKAKIIEPILSRCAAIDFNITSQERPKLAQQFFKRVLTILEKENVEYDKSVLIELIMQKFPDFRNTLNVLQMYAAGGKIDTGIFAALSGAEFKELVNHLKEKDFTAYRKWLIENSSVDSAAVYRELYDRASTIMTPESVPELVLILAKYQAQDPIVADKEINTMACLLEIMVSCHFK